MRACLFGLIAGGFAAAASAQVISWDEPPAQAPAGAAAKSNGGGLAATASPQVINWDEPPAQAPAKAAAKSNDPALPFVDEIVPEVEPLVVSGPRPANVAPPTAATLPPTVPTLPPTVDTSPTPSSIDIEFPAEPVTQEVLPYVPKGADNALTLQQCIDRGMQYQPALTAARASLSAAWSGKRGLDRLRFAALLSPDIPLRRQQACLGIQVAEAGLFQAEVDARYAVTRNYYSVLYARAQEKVALSVVEKLDRAAKRAQEFLNLGDPKIPITKIDVDALTLNRDIYKAKHVQALRGIDEATAALREAIGLPLEHPLVIAADTLPALVEGLNKEALVAEALARRGEMQQAYSFNQVTELEIRAQGRIFGPQGRTFASGADIHVKPIPQGVANGEYRPEAIGPEMPGSMAGPRRERMARASDLNDRAGAVVNKTQNLITLEVEIAYLKWLKAAEQTRSLKNTFEPAQRILDNVQTRFYDNGKASGKELIEAQTQVDLTRALYNEALYMHALALAGLERITAGGYRVP